MGQPSEAQFVEVADCGYDALINLAMSDHECSIATEGSVVTSLGMTYIHILVQLDSPNENNFETFSGYMNILQNKKVWVHCIVNARVSAFLFRYLQDRGFSGLDAKTPILEHLIPQMDVVWKKFIGKAKEQL